MTGSSHGNPYARNMGTSQGIILVPSSSPTVPEPHHQSHPSSQPQNAPDALPMVGPSRDSSHARSTGTRHGFMLAPNSSPTVPEPNHHSYPSSQPQNVHDALPMAGPSHHTPWGQPGQPHNQDPLSASSGFVNGGRAVYAPFTRSSGGDTRRLSEVDGSADDGPPRKRINRGGPTNSFPVPHTHPPDSPEIQCLGQRRKVNLSLGGMSTSSEDSMPDIRHSLESSVTRPSRVLRGRRPGSSELTEPRETTQNKDTFAMFRLSNIDRDVYLVQAAWTQAGGDERKATSLLNDSLWKPPSLNSEPKSPRLNSASDLSAETGRVAEVDEATKANRAALREKAKKSSIYANRAVLDANQTTPTSAVSSSSIPMVASPTSPSTPLVALRRRRVNKVVVSDSDQSDSEDGPSVNNTERGALNFLNAANTDGLQELTGTACEIRPEPEFTELPLGCTSEQADKIISLRPFVSVDDVNVKLGQGRKKAGPAGISPRLFEDCQRVLGGYGAVDSVLEKCERIGASLRAAIASWSVDSVNKGKTKEDTSGNASVMIDEAEEGSLNLKSVRMAAKEYFAKQPAILNPGVMLKDYQLLGINWLYLLYKKEYSCILADEMGEWVWSSPHVQYLLKTVYQVLGKLYRSLASLLI